MTTEGDGSEPLSALLRRYQHHEGEPGEVHTARLADAIAGRNDPLKVVEYMSGLGIEVRELDDLLKINADGDEEELHAFRVREGVAVSVASDGAWALFTP